MILFDTVTAELDSRGWTLMDLADRSGVEYVKLREAINELCPMDSQVTRGLAKAFGTSEELWINLGKQ